MDVIDKMKSWCDFGQYRNEWSSFISGILFFIGWWLIIDISALYGTKDFNLWYYTIGLLATLGLILVNTVTNEQINGHVYTEGCCGPQTARVWLLMGFVLAFVSVIASIWILFEDYVMTKDDHKYPGIALFMQNALIFGSSLLLKYGRTEERF